MMSFLDEVIYRLSNRVPPAAESSRPLALATSGVLFHQLRVLPRKGSLKRANADPEILRNRAG